MIGIQSADVKVGVGSAGQGMGMKVVRGEIVNVYYTFIACLAPTSYLLIHKSH